MNLMLWLWLRMEDRGMTLPEVSEKSGIGMQRMFEIRQGSYADSSEVEKIAEAIGEFELTTAKRFLWSYEVMRSATAKNGDDLWQAIMSSFCLWFIGDVLKGEYSVSLLRNMQREMKKW